MSWTVRPWLRRTLTAWREVSAAAAARLALSASSARSPRRSLTTLLCPLLCEEKERSKEQRSVVSEKRARRPRSQPCPHRNRNTLSLPTGDHESALTPPACAGQTWRTPPTSSRPSLYPRAHGANVLGTIMMVLAAPLPPRARGKRLDQVRRPAPLASTPACAGQTGPTQCWAPSCSLYPRVRGANAVPTTSDQWDEPLPPRARGKLTEMPQKNMGKTSTPACAGQTASSRRV